MNNVVALQKIKWTIVYKVNDDFGTFTNCLMKLLQSIDCKRSEILMLSENEDSLFLDTYKSLCEKYNISYNYVDNYEHAISIAKGNYIVYLTDHVFPSKNFLVKLTFCMDNYDNSKKVSFVSPISNDFVPNLQLTPQNVDIVQTQVSRAPKNNIPWAQTLNLSLSCLLINKDFYNSPLLAKLNFKDQILTALYNNSITILANDTIVFHYPEHIDNVYEIYNEIENSDKLAVLYRIKIDEPYIKNIFVKSLEKSITFADNIYVLDDNSKEKISLFLKENRPDLWAKITKFEKFSRPYDERRDLNELLSWAELDGNAWAFMLEGDEIVEDKVNKQFLSTLLKPVNMETMAYNVSHFYMWDNENQWRFDPPWGKMSDTRICRLIPNKKITKTGLVAAQTGYVPDFPSECIKNTSIKIKNYGYLTKEQRLYKSEFFTKLNLKDSNGRLLNFNHILNINGAYFYPWLEDTTVCFYTPTNKGGNLLYNWLDNISSFADEILVGNDSNSLTQQDLLLLQKYPNVKVIPTVMADDYGTGRNTIIKEAKSDWILQLDIDERLEDIMPLSRMVHVPNYEAWMFSIPNIQKDGGVITTETMRLFRNKEGVQYWGRLHETIDKHVREKGWRISKSPLKLIHYGYTLQTDEEAFKKMQKYLEVNLKQIKDDPMHGLSYYNVALHFLEDDLIDDAVKLLQLCIALQPGFPLASLELSKAYIKLAHKWMELSIRGLPEDNNLKQGFTPIKNALAQILPKNFIVAKNHCMQYFASRPNETVWLRDHIIKMEKTIDNIRTKQLEQMSKK
jgi:hypothetical protein